MTDDQKGLIVGMLHTTIDYLHAMEVIFIQLTGTVESSMDNPPAKKTSAQESVDMEKALEVLKNTVYKDHQFPWGGRVKQEPCSGVLLDDLPKGVFKGDPRKETPDAHD